MAPSSRYRGPLISRLEAALVDGAVAALWIMPLLRLALGYLLLRQRWLLDSQIGAVLLLSASIQLASAFCPRPLAWIPGMLGISGWLLAASLIPKFGWPREPWPQWMLIASAAVFLAVQIVLLALRSRWRRTIRGHGFEWMLDWGWERPYQARRVLSRTMRILGYSREE